MATAAASEASTALLTDRYELSMLEAVLRSGDAGRRSAFEVFARRLPPGRAYGVVAGVRRLVALLARFRCDDSQLEWMRTEGVVGEAAAAFLADFRFAGTIDAYADGELWFPGSPVLQVRGTLAECMVIETLVLSVLNHDSAVAAAASRMLQAADGVPLIEMGTRRTHEQAAVACAQVACELGFAGTSNLEAGLQCGVQTMGTMAHSYVLAHAGGFRGTEEDAERAAFASWVEVHGAGSTLLVDTFDVARGIDNAVAVTGPALGAIRLDSGDLLDGARAARDQLDSLGATATRIVVSGDLDEHRIAEMVAAGAPIDSFGVGTSLVTGSGHPAAGFVYKLVAVAPAGDRSGALVPVAKQSSGKRSRGGAKTAIRLLDVEGRATAELAAAGPIQHNLAGRRLAVKVMKRGLPLLDALPPPGQALRQALAEIPAPRTALVAPEPALPTIEVVPLAKAVAAIEVHA